jgi:Fe2+ transport system protein FeoA
LLGYPPSLQTTLLARGTRRVAYTSREAGFQLAILTKGSVWGSRRACCSSLFRHASREFRPTVPFPIRPEAGWRALAPVGVTGFTRSIYNLRKADERYQRQHAPVNIFFGNGPLKRRAPGRLGPMGRARSRPSGAKERDDSVSKCGEINAGVKRLCALGVLRGSNRPESPQSPQRTPRATPRGTRHRETHSGSASFLCAKRLCALGVLRGSNRPESPQSPQRTQRATPRGTRHWETHSRSASLLCAKRLCALGVLRGSNSAEPPQSPQRTQRATPLLIRDRGSHSRSASFLCAKRLCALGVLRG